ncbi:UNVERIFIED_CONTAM: tRNA (adenosine(37)-N6)-threonylcarbamoyltransferase complex ATPase subunit type 1 TsaE [Euhalothece sp. KZN 001]
MTQSSWEVPLANATETQELGAKMAKMLPPNTVILLGGELGAGKTTYVQGLGKGLGITTPIVSPTFTLINEYLEGEIPLYHLDLYRLETPSAIEQLFPETYWEGKEVKPGITAIEWSERLPYFPEHYVQVELLKTETSRQAQIKWHLSIAPPK